jgi:hypothetical protein
MPRPKSGDDLSGKYDNNRRSDQLKRNNLQFKKDQIGKFLPSFRRSANFWNGMDDEDSKRYGVFEASYIYSGTYLADACLEAIQRYHKIGHYDEVVAAQETAFDTEITTFTKVFGNIMPMFMIHDYFTNPPTDETNDLAMGTGADGDQVDMPLFERDTIATELLAMERAGVVYIPGLLDILKKVVFVVEEYEPVKVGATFSPGCNFFSTIPWDKLSDWQTNVDTLITNNGKFKKYCNMFGIPLKKFSHTDLDKCYTVYKGWDHPDLYAYLANRQLTIRGDDGGLDNRVIEGTYNPSTVSWIFLFKSVPDEAYEQHMINKLINRYNATYNLYGNLTIQVVGTNQNSVSMLYMYQDTSTQAAAEGFIPVATGTDSISDILIRYANMWMFKTADKLDISITGSYLTGDNDWDGMPMYHWINGYEKYGLMSNTKLDDVVVEYIANKLNLSNVKKNSFSAVS